MQPNKVAKWLIKTGKHISKDMIDSIYQGATDSKNRVKMQTPVRTGKLMRGWKVIKNKKTVHLLNTVPYSPYIERRLHLVTKEGLRYLRVDLLRALRHRGYK